MPINRHEMAEKLSWFATENLSKEFLLAFFNASCKYYEDHLPDANPPDHLEPDPTHPLPSGPHGARIP